MLSLPQAAPALCCGSGFFALASRCSEVGGAALADLVRSSSPPSLEKNIRRSLEQRTLAGFEEIERFVEQHGRVPERGEGRDIFECLYAVPLDRFRPSPECRAVPKDIGARGVVGATPDRTCVTTRKRRVLAPA